MQPVINLRGNAEKGIGGSSVAAEARFEARTNRNPIGFRKPPNQAYLTLQQSNGEQPEERWLMKSRLLPVAQFAIRRSQFLRWLCRDQTNDYVRPMTMVKFSREHHGGSELRRVCARKRADYNVTGLQRPSRSCCSNRSRDARVASRRSSSDQESDHSTRRPPARSASRCAQRSTFPASSGGSIRKTLMSDSSPALKTMLPIL